jgi:hypothetical protein
MGTPKDYSSRVFINCPFDDEYLSLRNALVFSIYDCGFVPRCALEEDNGGNVRFEKIQRLIRESKFGVHDVSRTELDPEHSLPRFNMPLELGVFLGAQKFGDSAQRNKNCLVLDREKYRYQKYISDIAGHDIRSHENRPEQLITIVRNWLSTSSGRKTIPGGAAIVSRYKEFSNALPAMCANVMIDIAELTYNDYSNFVSEWLQAKSK